VLVGKGKDEVGRNRFRAYKVKETVGSDDASVH